VLVVSVEAAIEPARPVPWRWLSAALLVGSSPWRRGSHLSRVWPFRSARPRTVISDE